MGTNFDKSENPSQVPFEGLITPIFTPYTVSPTTTDNSTSTISSSTATAASVSPSADLPYLDPAFSMSSNNPDKQSEIINSILDSWRNSLERQSIERREELRSPRYLAWLQTMHEQNLPSATSYSSWLSTLPSMERADEFKGKSAVVDGLSAYAQRIEAGNTDALSLLPLMTTTIVIGSTLIGQAIATTIEVARATATSAISFGQLWENSTAMIAGDMRAELGLIGALFAGGIIYQSTVENIANPANTVQEKNMNFAQTYAKNMIKLVSNPEFTQFLNSSILYKLEKGSPLTEQRRAELAAVVKTVLLASALVLVYKMETGKITGEEFMAMLDGQMKLPPGDVRLNLAALLNANLALVPSGERARLQSALAAYMDTDPSIDSLTEPNRVFAGLFKNLSGVGPIVA